MAASLSSRRTSSAPEGLVEDATRSGWHDKYSWAQFLEDQFLQATQTDGATLTKQMNAMAQTLSSKSSSIFGARPFLSVIPSPYFKAAFCGLALLYASLCVLASLTYIRGGIYKGRAFHFKVLELRDSSIPPAQFQLPEIGVRKGSCKRTDGRRTAEGDSETISITFDDAVEMDGWFFTTGGNASLTPAALQITIESEDGDTQVLEQPLWWTDWGIVHKRSAEWSFTPGEGAGVEIQGHTHPPEAWSVGIITEALVCMMGCVLVVSLAVSGLFAGSQRALAGLLAAVVASSLVVGVLLIARGEGLKSGRFWRAGIVAAILLPPASIASFEKVLVPVLFAAAAAYQLLLWLDYGVARQSPGGVLVTPDFYLALVLLLITAWLLFTWRSKLSKVARMVEQDQAAFTAAWGQALERTDWTVMEALKRACDKHPGASANPRQTIRIRVAVLPDGSYEVVRAGGVANLDQLYAQAAAAHLMLRRKAQELALRTRGSFPYTPRPAFDSEHGEAQRFVRAEDLMANPQTRQLLGIQEVDGPILWTEVKPVHRAMDKVLKQYHGDVGRLVDVSRETIVFDEVQHVLDCLEAIGNDPELEVVRVKNALVPEWDAGQTAGFRAVHINLRITSRLAEGLAVDGHVCELLLALRPIAEVTTHESHKRYVQFRDFRVSTPNVLRPAARRLLSVAASAVGLHSSAEDVRRASTAPSQMSPHSEPWRPGSRRSVASPGGSSPGTQDVMMRQRAPDSQGSHAGVGERRKAGSQGRVSETSNTPIIILKEGQMVQAAGRRRSSAEGRRNSTGVRHLAPGASGRRLSSLALVEEAAEERERDGDGKEGRGGNEDAARGGLNDAETMSNMSFRTVNSGGDQESFKSRTPKGFMWKEGEEVPAEVLSWARHAGETPPTRGMQLASGRRRSGEDEGGAVNVNVNVAGKSFGLGAEGAGDTQGEGGEEGAGAGEGGEEGAGAGAGGVRVLPSPPPVDAIGAGGGEEERRGSEAEAAGGRQRRRKPRGRGGSLSPGVQAAVARLMEPRQSAPSLLGGEVGARSPSRSPVAGRRRSALEERRASNVLAEIDKMASSRRTSTEPSIGAELVALSLSQASEASPVTPVGALDIEGDTIKSLPSPLTSRELSADSALASDPILRVSSTPSEDDDPSSAAAAAAAALRRNSRVSRTSRASDSNSCEDDASGIELSHRRRPHPASPADMDGHQVLAAPGGHGEFVVETSPHKLQPVPSPSASSASLAGDGDGRWELGGASEVEAVMQTLAAKQAAAPRRHSPLRAPRSNDEEPASPRREQGSGVARRSRKEVCSKLRVDVAGERERRRPGGEVRGIDEIMEVADWQTQGEEISNAHHSPEAAEDEEDRWLGLMREQFVRKALLPGGQLDAGRENIDVAIAEVKDFSVFETSYPVAAALSKPGFRFAICITAVLYFCYVGHEGYLLSTTGRIVDTKQVRFRPLMLQEPPAAGFTAPVDVNASNGSSSNSAVESKPAYQEWLVDWVLGIELLSGGCRVPMNATVLPTTREYLVIPREPVRFDGLVIATNRTLQDRRSTGFSLEAVEGDRRFPGPGGSNWRVIGGQQAYLTMHGLTQWRPSEEAAWFAEREGLWSISVRDGVRTARVTLSAPWYAWLGLFSLKVGLAVASALLFAVGQWGKAAWGKSVLVGMLLVVAACLTVNASCSLADRAERGSSAVLQLLNAGALALVGTGLLLREQAALGLWLYAALHFSVMHALEDGVLSPRRGAGSWLELPLMSYLFLAVGLGFVAMRQRVLVNSARDIEIDMQRYRDAWRRLLERPEEIAGLDQIQQEILEWSSTHSHPNWPVLQRCRAVIKLSKLERIESAGQAASLGGRLWGFVSTNLNSPFGATFGAHLEPRDEFWLGSGLRGGHRGSADAGTASPTGSAAVMSRGGQSSGASSVRTFGSTAPLLLAAESGKPKKEAKAWNNTERAGLPAPPVWATFKGAAVRAFRDREVEGRGGRGGSGGEGGGVRTLEPRGGGGVPRGLDAFSEEGSQIEWSSEEASQGPRSPESEAGLGSMALGARSSVGSLPSEEGAATGRAPRPSMEVLPERESGSEDDGSQGGGVGSMERRRARNHPMRRSASEGHLLSTPTRALAAEAERNIAGDPRGSQRLGAGERLEALRDHSAEGGRTRGVALGEGVDRGIVRTKSGGRVGESPQQRWRRKWLPKTSVKSFKSAVKGASFRQWRKVQSFYDWVGTFSSKASSNSQSSAYSSGNEQHGEQPERTRSGEQLQRRASRKSSWSERLSRSRTSSTSFDPIAMGSVQVTSLEQTYVQATGVYTMLKEKVQRWGALKGFFRVKKDRVAQVGKLYVPWQEVVADATKMQLVDWAGLKRPRRAVEKLVRSYGNRVCKLLDICRQSIVFESTQDIAECMRLVAEDDDVSILSIKNRLSRGYDDKETAGYRDVNINLRFRNEDAHRLGVEFHICELQLLLRSFAELKSDRGHARYVKFRNARAL